jgi:thioredoxin 1
VNKLIGYVVIGYARIMARSLLWNRNEAQILINMIMVWYWSVCKVNYDYSKRDSDMKEITDQDFEKEVLKCKLPVFACFSAEWCQSCYPTCLFADELAKTYSSTVKFVGINVDKSPAVSARYRIIPLPTIFIFYNSQPVKKLVGFQDRKSLKRLLDGLSAKKGLSRTGEGYLKQGKSLELT